MNKLKLHNPPRLLASAAAACLAIVGSAPAWASPTPLAPQAGNSGSATLLDFEDEAQFESLEARSGATIEPDSNAAGGRRAAAFHYPAVPSDEHRFPAVVLKSPGLGLTDFTPFEAISLSIRNTGSEDAELSIVVRDKDGNRAFPVPSTFRVSPGDWSHVVADLTLHGIDATNIESVHFFQKVNRRAYTLSIDDVRLLSPQAGRIAARIQQARDNLNRARANARALEAQDQIEPKIASLERRLDTLAESSRHGQVVDRTQHLLELAQIASAASSLTGSANLSMQGRRITFSGQQPDVGWLSNRNLVRRLEIVRLFDTSIGDEVFERLEPADRLLNFIASGGNLTGAGLERLTSDRLRVLFLDATSVHDDSLKHVGKFQSLEHVRLTDTNVTGGVLRHLSQLERLRQLALAETAVSDAGFSEISKLQNLEQLLLSRTSVSGVSLEHLKGLKKLRTLDLNETNVDDAGLVHLSQLYRLETLQLADTPVTGASFGELAALDALTTLNLNSTKVDDAAIRKLGALPKLKRLEISSTRITDGSLQHIARSAKLEYLDVYGTNITDAGLLSLRDQRGLQQLYLAGTQVSDRGAKALEQLNRITQLDLQGTRITDASLKYLKPMKNLVTLRLANTSITGSGLTQLSALSKLQLLDLTGTGVTNDALESIAQLPNLRRLYLGGTPVSDAGMAYLRRARRLVELNLEATLVGDNGVRALAALPNLQALNLNETNLTDTGLASISRAPRLESLSADHTAITDTGLEQLGDRYRELSFAHTNVTDLGVEQLQKNDQLTRLSLASTGITNNALRLLKATPNLVHLDVAQTNVTDTGLEDLAVLPALSELNLSGTAISDVGLDPLLKLRNLRWLALENSRVTSVGASYLRNRAPELQVALVFPWNWGDRWSYYSLPPSSTVDEPAVADEAGSLLTKLRKLSSLGYLHVGEALLTPDVLRSLKDLPALEHLSFEGTPITDEQLADLIGLSQVARLDLAGTSITDAGLAHLQDMHNLRELNLARTQVEGPGLETLANLPQLQSVNLRQTPLKDEGLLHLGKCIQLRKLELSTTEVADAGIRHLIELPGLQYLDLYGTQVTDAALSELKSVAPLRFLYLSNTTVTDRGVAHLEAMADLEELALDGTALSDTGLATVAGLKSLRRLRIGRTAVTEDGLQHVASLPQLVRLGLRGLPVTDSGLSILRSLSRLKALDLADTQVTDQALLALGEFPLLAELNVQDTAVTAPAAALFQQNRPDVSVTSGPSHAGYSTWSVLITVLYGIVVVTICFYGTHRYWLAWLFLRDKDARTSQPPAAVFEVLPPVTVQLPMFNERHVAERIIEAACALDYPADRLQIQVLDDSTDESADVARICCERLEAAGHNIEYLHRDERTGFKGGALADGMQSASGDFIAIFDADFIPPPDILRNMIHHFMDPKIGLVQAEWAHLNRDESLLTECQAMFLDGHFVVEQTVRSRNDRWFNFNGTAGIWRKRCIEEAGGWQHDTLTEDNDLSYRAQMAGWQFLYLPDVKCPAELPSTITAFLGQQHRWTKGLIQNARKLMPRILLSGAPWRVKLEAWFHLTSPLMYLVMFVLTAIALPALFFETPLTHWQTVSLSLGLGTLWLGTLAASIFYIVSQRAQGIGFVRTLIRLPVMMALGVGICVVTARAVVEALLGMDSPFVRTPKFGGRTDCDPDPAAIRRRVRIPTGTIELVIGGLLFACVVLSVLRPYTLIGAPFLLLFACGYSGVGVFGLLDRFSRSVPRTTDAPAATRPQLSARWLPTPRSFAIGTLAIVATAAVTGSMLTLTVPQNVWAGSRDSEPVSLGLDLTTADWRVLGNRQVDDSPAGAIKDIFTDRGSLVLNVELDQAADEGQIVLDLDGAVTALGDSLADGREITFDVEFPARFTGEFQAFVSDRNNRNEYGSMSVVENHDVGNSATVSLVPGPRVPPMGYKDPEFDPGAGIRHIGLKISAQSDRVRGAGYRPFRGTITVNRIRVRDIDPTTHPEPEIRPTATGGGAPPVSLEQFVAGSGVDIPWPLGYAFSGPMSEAHVDRLHTVFTSMARHGCSFTRVYIGDYRTGLLLDATGGIEGIEPAFLDYLDRLAEIANQQGITVMFSLTDNAMADGKGIDNVDFLVRGPASDQFISNALVPIIERLKGRKVIWDIFNEPENVTATPLRHVQQYVDRVLAAGRRADPQARFTVVSRGRDDLVYWQGRGLSLYSHNIFTSQSLKESTSQPAPRDAPIMVAEMAPELATTQNLRSLQETGYTAVGIWGWDTGDKYAWTDDDLDKITTRLKGVQP